MINISRIRLISLTVLIITLIIFSAVAIKNLASGGVPLFSSPPPDQNPNKPVIVEPKPPAPAPFNPTVGLYIGRGSWDPDIMAMHNFLNRYKLDSVEIDQETLSRADLNRICDILVFVGGFSSEYLHYIENHNNIRTFVEQGGCFVGFCAGAYYASSTMVWQGQELDYPLKLFSGEAAGPLNIGWGSLAQIDLNWDIPFNQKFGESIAIWYFDGPCFAGLEESGGVDVLARYSANGEAAVIAFTLGKGRVLLSGPHPELGYMPAEEQIDMEGGSGAQWPWLYAALHWLSEGEKTF